MAGRIPPELIDQILARTDIVELIGRRLKLRKSGKDYIGLCPFHNEKTPSFTVSPDKQFYHCFGCGAHGSAIGFLMAYDRLSFREAVEELARYTGLELPTESASAQAGPDYEPLYQLLQAAADYYRHQLGSHPQAKQAIEYLKGRGLTGEIAARFGLGYAPPDGLALLRRFGTDRKALDHLLTAGLIAVQDGHHYDRFRGRIMFPIRDQRGRVIGFGGRLLGEGQPKYLNSPKTPIFHKGRALYGLYEAHQVNRTLQSLIVVEGYLDVIALAQFGITQAVATLGTATTAEQLNRLFKLAPEIVFCFDGDRAGRAAAWRALETALPLVTGHQSIRFLFLPEGEDPDTLVRREGRDGFQARLKGAEPLSEVLFAHHAGDFDLTIPDGRLQYAGHLIPLLERLPPGPYRTLLAQRLGDFVGLPIAQLSPSLAPTPVRRGPSPRAQHSLVAQAVAILLDRPHLARSALALSPDWRRSNRRGIAILVQLLDALAQSSGLSKAQILERWRDQPYFDYLQELTLDPLVQTLDEAGAEAELIGAMERLNTEVRDQEWRQPFNKRSPSDWTDEERSRLSRRDR